MNSKLPPPHVLLDELAQCSLPGPGVTRLPFTAEHRAAVELLTQWMQQAGLETHLDEAGTLIGRKQGTHSPRTFFLGSHQDSVRNGGIYDGAMGVVLPICAMARLEENGVRMPWSVEILAFADEEGVRFPTALLGPRCLAGTFDPEVLGYEDENGTCLQKAIREFGLDPKALPGLKRKAEDCIGYLELHIEQGPMLESLGLPVGVVTAICGIERQNVKFTGQAGHAGTIPMAMRKDALAGAAEFICQVERECIATDSMLGCIGSMSIHPGVVNAIPGEVSLTLELRAPDDLVRKSAVEHIYEFGREIANRRGLQFEASLTYLQKAVKCSDTLSLQLGSSVSNVLGQNAHYLPSGATHDASAMSDLTDTAMLFIRCRDGVSHRPEEWVDPRDMSLAVEVLVELLPSLDF